MTTHTPGGAAYTLRGALASLRHSTCRVWCVWSVWSKPLTRVLLLIAGLAALAIIGRTAGAHAEPPSPAPIVAESLPPDAGPREPPAPPVSQPCGSLPSRVGQGGSQAEASADDPVILNTAQADDLRRLPGVGAKRAEAILALRTRLGRFRQLEDLLRVRGIGRATLRRLRPLVRLDPPTPPPP